MNAPDTAVLPEFTARPREFVPNAFTASELARPLRRLPQAVRNDLSAIAPDTKKIISGKQADAWREASLPNQLRQSLEAARNRAGARSLLELVSMPPALWQPRDRRGQVL